MSNSSCLHFKVDRITGICPTCGWQSPYHNNMAPVVEIPLVEIPTVTEAAPIAQAATDDSEDIHALVAALKRKPNAQAPLPAPPAPANPPAPPVPVQVAIPVAETIVQRSFEELAADRDRAVAAATPDWIKPQLTEAELDKLCAPTPEETKYAEGVADILRGVPVQSTVQVQGLIEEDSDQEGKGWMPGIKEDPRFRDVIVNVDGVMMPLSMESKDYAPGTYPDEPVFSFLGGTAGTGKTYTAQRRVEAYDDAKLVATTGIAAVNLGGITINSLLQYGDTLGLRANYETGKLGALLKRMTNSGYYRLIVDEVSMMDGHQLDILVTAIEELNEWLATNNKRLFGLTLVGDFAQLPPIDAPFVFQRPTWGRFEPNITLLTEPRRQADPEFVRALQAVRRGDRQAALAYFGSKIVQGSEEKFDGSTIVATNAEVDRYNKLRMMDITAPADWYTADRVGEQLSEWKKNIPDTLEMKPGALVMILANKTWEGSMLYANGDLGHYVRKVTDRMAEVELLRGHSVQVEMVIKEKGVATGHSGKKLPRNEVKGSIRYMPLRIAYATTCHKSQGLSLDRVQIMFHNKFWASPGMLYVALSRARTPQGLRLVGTPEQFEARVNVNPDIRRWL